MASYRKRNELWQAQVRRVGHAAISRSFTSKSDAIAWATSQEHLIQTGDLRRTDRTSHTLEELLDRYEREVIPLKRTDSGEAFLLRSFRRSLMCTKPLSHLKAQDFASFRDRELKSSRPATVVRKLSVLRHALRIAGSEWGWTSPLNELAKIRFPSIELPATRRISDEEIDRFLVAASSQRNRTVGYAVKLALGTGMRRGELLRLCWDDVDSLRHALTIQIAKNGRGRIIPITRAVTAQLLDIPKMGTNVLPITANALRLGFDRARKKRRHGFPFP